MAHSKIGLRFEVLERIFETQLRIPGLRIPAEEETRDAMPARWAGEADRKQVAMSSITISPAMGVRPPTRMSAARPMASSRPAPRSTHSAATSVTSADAVARTRTPLRLTQRGRTVLLSILALPLVVGIAVAALDGGGATATMSDPASLQYVMVAPGQTLWGLATELAPGADPRDVIDDIMRFNRLGSADLAAGQQLAIPPKYVD